MNLSFDPTGVVSGYKTKFFKNMFPELKGDNDVVAVFSPISETSVAICLDMDGHICSLCKQVSHLFAEFEKGDLKRICSNCSSQINAMLQNISQ